MGHSSVPQRGAFKNEAVILITMEELVSKKWVSTPEALYLVRAETEAIMTIVGDVYAGNFFCIS